MTLTDTYAALVDLGSSGAGVGGMLITTLDPGPGDELRYTRWYEDDHFISGAMVWPWVFAGKRWVAPKKLKALRQPESSNLIDPDTRISFFHTYLISEGHVGDVEDFGAVSLQRLEGEQRLHWEIKRTHVYTNFQDFVGAAYADGFEPRAQHVLDYPFKSVVLEVIDAPTPNDRERLSDWVLSERAPQLLAKGTSVCMVLTPRPRKIKGGSTRALDHLPASSDARITVLWFSDAPADRVLDQGLSDEADALATAGVGDLQLLQPFCPAVHGTSAFAAEL